LSIHQENKSELRKRVNTVEFSVENTLRIDYSRSCLFLAIELYYESVAGLLYSETRLSCKDACSNRPHADLLLSEEKEIEPRRIPEVIFKNHTYNKMKFSFYKCTSFLVPLKVLRM